MAIKTVKRAVKKRLNVNIPEKLYKMMKIRATEDGKSVSKITRELWEKYLKL